MILPEFILPSRVNQRWKYSGIDSLEISLDKKHFKQYPHHVDYQYNSRGFRDAEWPDNLQDSIWCLGDSFTVGIGCPVTHSWPSILQQQTGKRTINVSMDGASNSWIARKAVQILQQLSPELLVIHWSYIERREHPDITKDDEQRRLPFLSHDLGIVECLLNFQQCVNQVEQHKGATRVIHSTIPDIAAMPQYKDVQRCWTNIAGPDWPSTLPNCIADIPDFVVNELKMHQAWDFIFDYYHAPLLLDKILRDVCYTGPITKIDLARDGHHYDIETAKLLVNKIQQLINVDDVSNQN